MKFLVPNYSCLQNHWLGGYRPQIPILSVLSTEFVESPPNKIPGYATDSLEIFSAYTQEVNLKVLRFCFGPDVCTGNFSVKICGVMSLPGSVRNIILLHTHPILSQNFTTNFFFTPIAVHTRHFSCVPVTNPDWPNFVEFCLGLPTNAIISNILSH